MFRNPRENDSRKTSIKPSTGRAPTPPTGSGKQGKKSTPASSTRRSSTKPLTPAPMAKSNAPTPGCPEIKKAFGKAGTKSNHSILNFFKKVESPQQDDSASNMFIADKRKRDQPVKPMSRSTTPEELRFNECSEPVKRQRLSASLECSPPPPEQKKVDLGQEEPENVVKKPKKRRLGPFLDDSDSEDEVNSSQAKKAFENADQIQALAVKAEKAEIHYTIARQSKDSQSIVETKGINQEDISENKPIIPPLSMARPFTKEDLAEDVESKPSIKREDTFDEFGDFGALEDFQDDEYLEGEEFVERKWMEEQAMLEDNETDGNGAMEALEQDNSASNDTTIANCPICDAKLDGITNDQASIHVNACLDGKPIPLPNPVKSEPTDSKAIAARPIRFSRASIAKPGQENPFEFGNATATSSSSAFSKLMSSKAEDTAWANAAAAEHAARGKPAYQRTCPFYKIMPGLFICVDAFRYGAVKGCNAYFLSHFHSDHYVGLSSTWCHGPIYCSKVTANLVKQQLRVDPKYVVPLEFDSKVEVPGTEGVSVTMIPANHCPGSSLFLFEKVIGKGSSPRVQRILHCGDFRACPAHVAHPLLMPDIVDSITGKTKQQKIDVCYLDTTYLNPKYAFPSQNDVIQACADMCVSLKKDKAEEGDAWEVVKRERAGAGMAKFISGKTSVKAEDDSIAMSLAAPDSTDSKQGRGRLLVICGTYSIGKERICLGIARALDCKIWAPPGKQRICAALEDPELSSRLTNDPKEAQIHMQMLMEIRAETLQDYLNGYKPHFSRIVGFRPSGWNYRPPNSRFVESPSVQTVLHSDNWRSRYSMVELIPQRGSTREASCFGVPYSEHSSFRELTMFCCALRIEKVIPTVNVGSAPGRAKMKTWIDRWLTERRKNGVIKLGDGVGEVKW